MNTLLALRVSVLFAVAASQLEAAPPDENGGTEAADRKVAAVTFVSLGYGDIVGRPFSSESFTTCELDTLSAQEVVRLVKKYNRFEGEKVAAALARWTGKTEGYRFGREGSPVLYVRLPYWTHQAEGRKGSGQGRQISDEATRVLVAEMRSIFLGELQADEWDVDETGHSIRIWWD